MLVLVELFFAVNRRMVCVVAGRHAAMKCFPSTFPSAVTHFAVHGAAALALGILFNVERMRTFSTLTPTCQANH